MVRKSTQKMYNIIIMIILIIIYYDNDLIKLYRYDVKICQNVKSYTFHILIEARK